MFKISSLILMLVALFPSKVFAEWTEYLTVTRVEVHASGVFLGAVMSGLTEGDCSPEQTYIFARFPSSNEKLADRALSSAYFALASNKKLRVFVTNCNGPYAISNAIWIEP